MDVDVRRHAQSRRDDQAARPERGVPESEDDLARVLPGLAGRRAPDDGVRPGRPEQAAAHLRAGARHRRGAQSGAQHRLRSAAGRLRSDDRADVRRRCAARWRCRPASTACAKTPTAELKMLGDANPRSFPVQVALGRALRKDGQIDEAMQAFERAAALVPVAGGVGQSARSAGRDGAREEGSSARDRRAHRAGGGRLQQRRGGAAAGAADAARAASTTRRSCGRSISGSPPSIRSMPTHTPMLGRFALQRNEADNAVARVPDGNRARPGRSRRGLHRSRGELSSRPASAPRPRSRRSRRSRSRRATNARRDCC